MTKEKADLFMATMGEKFTPSQRLIVYEKLLTLPDERFGWLQTLAFKDPIISLLLSLFLGYLGIDRMMVGDVGLGILKLLTCGGLGIWTVIDWFLIMNRTREVNFNLFMQYAR